MATAEIEAVRRTLVQLFNKSISAVSARIPFLLSKGLVGVTFAETWKRADSYGEI